MTKSRDAALAATGVLVVCCAHASGATIFALEAMGPFNAGTTGDRLIRFDSSDPANVAVLGETNWSGFMTGLDFTPDGNLWASGLSSDFTTSVLHQIDAATGNASAVGAISGLLGDDTIDDITYNPADGQMYGVSLVSNAIYVINTASAQASFVGQVSGLPSNFGGTGLAAASSGMMYLVDIETNAVHAIDGSLNVVTTRNLGFDAEFDQGLVVDWSRDDMGYAATFEDGVFDGTAAHLLTFDAGFGPLQDAGVIGPGIPDPNSGMDFFAPVDVAILPLPAPGTSAALLIAGVAIVRRGRGR
ncbi:MAG: DUF4394 domain-containing protein [Planctomycetota bacterium]